MKKNSKMMKLSFSRSKGKTQFALANELPACERAETPMQSAEMRQLTADEYAAVAGGPEFQVGDGT